MIRVGVVGHVEWMQFATVARMPRAGEIVHAVEHFEEAAGGGAVAAAQLRKLAGAAVFLTALGNEELGWRAEEELRERHRLDVHAAWSDEPQRRGFTHLDADGERTITILGPRLTPRRTDALPWDWMPDMDGVFVTATDADGVRAARGAHVLVATSRIVPTLAEAGVGVDALVGSAIDPDERYVPGTLRPEPRWVVRTRGAQGGEWTGADGSSGVWPAVAPAFGETGDAYGAGDCFAAGLTYGLAGGRDLPDALELAARCGAACISGRGPYEGQMELSL